MQSLFADLHCKCIFAFLHCLIIFWFINFVPYFLSCYNFGQLSEARMASWIGNLTLKFFSFRRNDFENQENKATAKDLVVIGSGFGRTGTASLKTALEIILEGPCYHMVESFKSK